ncbi:BMP family ABC transporter substrate-binding protein [Spirochaetia bacterium]|nr:BMP family ABC transporter substrate-binding protein [Spirochaetia bacterium]
MIGLQRFCIKKLSLPVCIIALLGMLLNCGGKNSAAPWRPGKPMAKEKIKIGVLHITDPFTENSGYSYAHQQGIMDMQKELGLKDEQLIVKINVQDSNVAGIESAIRDCIALGANIIIATSWGYMDSCEKLSAEFPQVLFAHGSGYKYNDTNFTNYFGRIYQARYLSGIAAGLRTKTGRIGYVAAWSKDNSEETGSLNAFALGVEQANPSAKIYVKVTYSWYDPMGESSAARSLIAEGCDVIAQGTDSATPQVEAEKAGVWGIGYNTDMFHEAPAAVITSAIWHWGAYYTYLVRGVMDGSFTTVPYFGGLAEGMVDISAIAGWLVVPGTAEAVEAARNRILREGFNVFDGVLETNDGKTVGKPGATLSDRDITENMNWYYRNIVEEKDL